MKGNNKMNKKEFKDILMSDVKLLDIELNENQIDNLYKYMDLLIEWNKKINLTAIVEQKEIIKKHFVDSLTISKYIDENARVIDVGTGAGLPGIPLKMVKDKTNITLLDSLNKRLIFLEEVINNLKLKNISTKHSRAEEAGTNKEYREKFDISISRAVAPLNVLVEYLLPFVKLGGKVICMKGSNVEEELQQAQNAIKILGGEIEKIDSFLLPNTDMKRNILVIKKVKNTPNKYPRKAGTPVKQPII